MVAFGSTTIDTVKFGSLDVTSLYLGSNEAWTASKPGMVLLTPTSITHAGTSASVGANGQVTFTAVTSLSLNGVFSADFDNYVVNMRHNGSADTGIALRMRSSGTDASGNDYTYQLLSADSTAVSGSRTSSTNLGVIGIVSIAQRGGDTAYFFCPFLAQPTAVRTVSARALSNAAIYDYATTHSLSISYDGFTAFPASGNMTGTLQVYGVRS